MNTNERIKIFKSLMGQAFSKEEVYQMAYGSVR